MHLIRSGRVVTSIGGTPRVFPYFGGLTESPPPRHLEFPGIEGKLVHFNVASKALGTLRDALLDSLAKVSDRKIVVVAGEKRHQWSNPQLAVYVSESQPAAVA